MRSTLGRFTSLAMIAGSAVFLGCADSPTSPDALDSNPAHSLSAGNPVVFSARGSGHIEAPPPGGTEAGWRTFAFNAVERLDGTVTGTVQYDVHDQSDPAVTHRIHGRVICVTGLGDGMYVIGARGLMRSPYDTPPVFAPFGQPLLPPAVMPDDWGFFLVIRDNGEGASATGPDQLTGSVHTNLASVAVLCQLGANHPLAGLAGLFLADVESGNIQVSQ